MGIVVLLLVALVAGIASLGFAFMQTSMIEHAARDGARFAATLPVTPYRDKNTGCFTGGGASTAVKNHVNDILNTAGFNLKGGPSLTVDVSQTCDGNVPTVTVRIHGQKAPQLIIPLI